MYEGSISLCYSWLKSMSLKTGCARTSIESSLLPILSLTLTRSSPLMRSSISSENLKLYFYLSGKTTFPAFILFNICVNLYTSYYNEH